MRIVLLIFICCLLTLAGKAQWSYKYNTQHKHFLYTSGDYIVGKCNGGNLGLNYVYNDKLTMSLGYTASDKTTCSLPEDFLKSGVEYTSVNSAQAFENQENLHFMVGTMFNITRNNAVRVLLQGGPGLSTFREPEFKVEGNQYSHKIQTTKKVSLVLNPKIEMPLFCTIGFSVGPMVVINKDQQYIGAGIGLMYGIVRSGKL